MHDFHAALRRIGPLALIGGVLIFGSVIAELFFPVQSADGTTTVPILHALYLVAWSIGWTLVAVWAVRFCTILAGVQARSRRLGIGSWMVVGGAAAFVLSALGQLAGVLAGAYLEGFFVLFLVAFPLLVAGLVLLAFATRRTPTRGGTWILLLLGGIGLLVALLAEADPYHDIGLLSGAAAIAAAGARLAWAGDRGKTRAVETPAA
jgi:hypothetical protein